MAIQTKEHEKVTVIQLTPGNADSGDLEVGTPTITAVAEPGTPDYSASLAVAANPASKIVYTKVGIRFSLTIDAINAPATVLNYAVKRGSTVLLSGSWNSTGAKIVGDNIVIGNFVQGAANQLDVYLWADNAAGVTISLVQLQIATGGLFDTGPLTTMTVTHSGLIYICNGRFRVDGSGTPNFGVVMNPGSSPTTYSELNELISSKLVMLSGTHNIYGVGTVATDLSRIESWVWIFREEE